MIHMKAVLRVISVWFVFFPAIAVCMDKDAKIYVAGHRGLVGSAIVRRLVADGYTNIIVRGSY